MSKKSIQIFGAPDFSTIKKDHRYFRKNYWNALSYAHYELANVVLKKETLKFLKTIKSEYYESAKNLHEDLFICVGKYCYIFNNGGDCVDDIEERLPVIIGKIISDYTDKKARIKSESDTDATEKKNKVVTTIQDRLKEKANVVIEEIDNWLDERFHDKKTSVKTVDDFLNLFNKHEVKINHIRHIVSFFEFEKNELDLALSSEDPEIKESFADYSKTELKHLRQFFVNLSTAVEQVKRTSTKTRSPRAKKPTDINKLVLKLKYLKEDAELGVASKNPVHVMGSKEVWIYNTRTRKLGCLKAYDERGLVIKGSSITNISVDSTEKTLRKPKEMLTEFMKLNKVKAKTFMKDLSTLDTMMKGRLNEHCLIVRIDN